MGQLEGAPATRGSDGEPGRQPERDDYADYLADMILELQQMAARTGRQQLAERLLAAYELARKG